MDGELEKDPCNLESYWTYFADKYPQNRMNSDVIAILKE